MNILYNEFQLYIHVKLAFATANGYETTTKLKGTTDAALLISKIEELKQ